MSLRSRPLSSLLAAFVMTGALSQAASCAFETYGTEPPTETTPCTKDEDCNDKDPCTADFCGETKTCDTKPVVDGIAPEQTAGDCKLAVCKDGKLTQTNDDEDLPNDLNSCTTDECATGQQVHSPLKDGDSCTLGPSAGLCAAGACIVECSPQEPCNDGNPCTEDLCNASTGKCAFSALDGLPTPGFEAVAGDCVQRICQKGADTEIDDPLDTLNDDNSCTKDECIMGTPMGTPVNNGLSCVSKGIPGICDAMGNCQQCLGPDDCTMLPVDNGCRTRTCNNNVCGQTFANSGSVVPSLTGDCKKNVCDGAGNIGSQVDNTDVPDDKNICTMDSCVAGVPTNTADPTKAGTSCGAGTLVCDALGQCQGCDSPMDCPGTDDDCKSRTCVNKQCGVSYTMQGTVVSTGQTVGDCKTIKCDGMGNAVALPDQADVKNDGNECTSDTCNAMGEPVNGFTPLNTACAQNGGTVCNGFGSCLDPNGTACGAGGECVSGFCIDNVCCDSMCNDLCMACNVAGGVGTCANVEAGKEDGPTCVMTNSCDGMGACKRNNGQPCGMGTECTSGFCADGVCCDAACTESCKSCDLAGKVGTCTVVVNDYDPSGPATCVVPYACDSKGACKGLNSLTCTQGADCISGYCVDGFCCNNVCNQLCKGCSGMLTGGNNGVCSNILNGTDPQNECPTSDCNGAGQCTVAGNLPIGAACTTSGSCASGFCADGVCCSTGCTESCKTCNAAGQAGTCVNVPNGQEDANSGCGPGYQCNGSGVCRGVNGVPCMQGSQCISNNCVEGFCCGNICDQPCKSCVGANTGGFNGVCGFILNGFDPDNECTGASNCNGAGMCTP